MERFIARAHLERQQGAGSADEHAADDEHVVLQLEAADRDGEPRERVQQRDDDRHVGAADGEHEHDAEERAAGDDRPEKPLVLDAGCERGAERRHSAASTARLTTFWPGYVIGRPLISSCSFAKATIEPANEMAPMRPESAIATS